MLFGTIGAKWMALQTVSKPVKKRRETTVKSVPPLFSVFCVKERNACIHNPEIGRVTVLPGFNVSVRPPIWMSSASPSSNVTLNAWRATST